MADAPDAPAEAPKAPESEAPQTTNTEQAAPAEAPDMHGFTSDELADIRKFFDASGGFEKVKSKISNPERPAEPVAEPQKTEPTSQQQAQPVENKYQRPAGARSLEEINTRRYFEDLAAKPQYAAISKEIEDGSIFKEMDSMGIVAVNPDYSINEDRLLQFLNLKAMTVPAKPTNTEPNASAAPTVTYTEVGDSIANIDQAYKVLMEPGNPARQKAEEYIKNYLNKK